MQYPKTPHDLLASDLLDLELHAAIYRKLPVRAQADRVIRLYRDDRARGLFEEVSASERVFTSAERFARRFCGVVGMRSLDLLHLATALESGAGTLAIFDGDLARAAQMSELDIYPPRP